jgi:hypothetical protein
MLVVFLNPRRLFLFFRDIIIGSDVFKDLVEPRGIAFELPAGDGVATFSSRFTRRFFRRRSLRAWVCGFPNPGGTGTDLR